jgi:hypothetical protein
MDNVCLVAILKDEEPFLDEWIIYHKLIGIEHFYLYDDNPKFPLQEFLSPYKDFITVINWYGLDEFYAGKTNQIKAYRHAHENYAKKYEWVTFLDGDEFIVVRKDETIIDFLKKFEGFSGVSLTWHNFGHNGYFENPSGLITSSLTRRKLFPDIYPKLIVRSSLIAVIENCHKIRMKHGLIVDANKKGYSSLPYPGKTADAHINHYQCRSFQNWMERVKRGDVNFTTNNSSDVHNWRFSEETCLRKFVETVAKDKNEHIDSYMLKYEEFIIEGMKSLER